MFHPKTPVALEANTEVRLTVETFAEEPKKTASFLRTARSLNLQGPPDWSANLDRYLYGDDHPRASSSFPAHGSKSGCCMATLREEAEFHRLALAMSLIDVEAVVAWADRTIVSLPEPPMPVIDVALAGSRPADELVGLLATVPGGGDLTLIAHQVLAIFDQRFRAVEIALDLAVDMLWAYHNWADVPEEERSQAANFYDALFCVQQGYYGTLESVREEILDFLARYAAGQADNAR